MPTDWSARTAAIPYFEKLVKRLKLVNDDDKELYEAALHALRRSQDHTAIQTKLNAATQELRNIADAKRFDRNTFDNDTAFADWAQSRARHTLGEPGE